ncbi:MAG TPA: hypothetical protein VML19_12635 [Verrucomicrobiae bacterium]|nr:hypothetical protein [Verrucomicrobiae bacterium]
MFLPQTYGAALIVLILGVLCLGSWASLFKSAKLRYELSYFDFAVGALVFAAIFGLTVGNLGFDGFSLSDDLSHAGKRQWFYAFLAGVVFNFGNMLLMSSASISGISVAFPTAFSIAMILSTVVQIVMGPSGNMTLNISGCALLLAAVIFGAIAHNIVVVLRHEAKARIGKAKSTRRPVSIKPVVLAIFGGLLLGACLPLVDQAQLPDIGLGPFSLTLMFSVGMIICTAILSVFFINLPVEGEPAELSGLLNVTLGTHFRAFLSGGLWCTGVLGLWVAINAVDLLKDIPVAVLCLKNSAPLLTALWGLLAFREFRDGDMRARSLAMIMLLLFAGGVVMLALAPLHTPKPT